MKFTIDKNIILENLMNVARAISTKNVIPVLNGIKFEMTDEGLYLIASDSELTIKSFIEKKDIKNVEALGNIIIQSKFIVDIIRKMPSDIINFEVLDGLKIKIYTSAFFALASISFFAWACCSSFFFFCSNLACLAACLALACSSRRFFFSSCSGVKFY